MVDVYERLPVGVVSDAGFQSWCVGGGTSMCVGRCEWRCLPGVHNVHSLSLTIYNTSALTQRYQLKTSSPHTLRFFITSGRRGRENRKKGSSSAVS